MSISWASLRAIMVLSGSDHKKPPPWLVSWRTLESVGLEVEEIVGLSDGPPGEFPTVNGYFRVHKREPAEASTFP